MCGSVVLTPGDQGNYSIEVQCSDGYAPAAALPVLTMAIDLDNRSPTQRYAIPLPAPAFAQQPWSLIIASDNFLDEDGDPLGFELVRPPVGLAWVQMDVQRRMLYGTPSGGDRGTFPATLRVTDAFGGMVAGGVNITVANSVPVPDGKLFDQQVSLGQATEFVFSVPSFTDPDGDA